MESRNDDLSSEEEEPVGPLAEKNEEPSQARANVPYPELSSVGKIEWLFEAACISKEYPSLPPKTKRENMFEPAASEVAYPKPFETKEGVYLNPKKSLPNSKTADYIRTFSTGRNQGGSWGQSLDAIKKSKPQIIADYRGSSNPFVRAIMNNTSADNFVKIVRDSKESVFDYQQNDTKGNTLAHIAALVGNADLAIFFSKKGYCDLRDKNKQGYGVLEYSQLMNDESTKLQEFISKGRVMGLG